jgi:septal ring factor EnvC (AmiA/AmiB activator)
VFTTIKILFSLLLLFAGSVFAQSGRVGADLPAWVEIENKIAELSAKIKSKTGNLQGLIKQKQSLDNDAPQMKELLNSIVKEHNELEATILEYEKQKNVLRYRFPERGSQAERRYKKVESTSLQELERVVGIDGKLNRNLDTMKTHYGSKKAEVGTGPTPTTLPRGTSIEDQDPITLQK